jgi:hypothetical protein
MVATKRSSGAVAAPGLSKVQQPAAQTKSEKPVRRAQLHHQLQKTKLCSYHLKGACHYGADCAFAHTCTELQATPDLRKTRLCKAFMEGGCTNEECTFAHGETELVSTDLYHKRSLCKWNEKGKCRNGSQCRFAHGLAELRPEGAVEQPGARPPTPPSPVPALGRSAVAPQPMKVRTTALNMNLASPVSQLAGAATLGGGGAAALASLGLNPQLASGLAQPAPWPLNLQLAQGLYEEAALQAELAQLKENISAISHQWNSIQSRIGAAPPEEAAVAASPEVLAAMASALEEAQAQAAMAGQMGFGAKTYAGGADMLNMMDAMNMTWMYDMHPSIGA